MTDRETTTPAAGAYSYTLPANSHVLQVTLVGNGGHGQPAGPNGEPGKGGGAGEIKHFAIPLTGPNAVTRLFVFTNAAGNDRDMCATVFTETGQTETIIAHAGKNGEDM